MSGTKPFQLVTKNCRKNDALLSSVIPHAQALKNFIGHQARCVLNLNAATNLAKKKGRGLRLTIRVRIRPDIAIFV